jgi:hypothetical protein
MISPYSIPRWSQRDPRWSGQRLGLHNPKGGDQTIGQAGCLITAISMMNAGYDPNNWLQPNQVDDLFSGNNGYASYNLVIWNAINRLLPNCATAGQVFCATSPAPVEDIKAHLEAGQLAILQVGFAGNPSNMHFLLAVGHDGFDLIFNDPWYGDQSRFASNRYGTGDPVKDILAVHYFSDAIPEPVKPATPVAARPAEAPLLGYQRVIKADANCNYRVAPHTDAAVIKLFEHGLTLDFKGFVHGQSIEGNDIWFVGLYSDGFVWSGCFTDAGTHDLPDLTPQPTSAATPANVPDPVVEATPEPLPVDPEPEEQPTTPETSPQVETPVETVDNPEEHFHWVEDQTIPQKIVAVPEADVIDALTGEVVKKLPGGELIAQLGGYFTYNGSQYVRTQSAVENGWWNGILTSELEDYVPEPPEAPSEPTTSPSEPSEPVDGVIDGIMPPDISKSVLGDPDWKDLMDTAAIVLAGPPRIPVGDIVKAVRDFGLGVLLSPLRVIGWLTKLVKGV